MISKVVTLQQAVAEHIHNGDSVVLGACLEPMIPFAVSYEIVRQHKTGLNIIAPISDISSDILIGAGAVNTITGAWVGNVSEGLGHNYRRAMEQNIPHPVTLVDHSNFSLGMALLAAAYGMPFAPNKSLLGSDILTSNPQFDVINNPLTDTEDPIVLIPPLTPDVAVLPVQRADRYGGTHFWGNTGLLQEAALASQKILVLTEEIVDSAVIRSDPNRVLFADFQVCAVVEVQAATHPSPMTGIWQRDTAFFGAYHQRTRTREGFLDWLHEWVLDLPDHAAYCRKLGQQLDDLRIQQQHLSVPVNFADQ
ncbi:MAG TPA: CoA transferase subunit A [Gammaproteobacteria bacterium]|nr:CoA transferase subunit A [Gammaproteobacteria bacterium]